MSDPMDRAIELAVRNVAEGGRPFACVIANDEGIVAESPNLVAQTSDPTAHAEILAIRAACTRLRTEYLTDCDVYAVAYPCPMCLGALYYCSPCELIYAVEREQYVEFYRDDRRYFATTDFYAEYAKHPSERLLPTRPDRREEALEVFRNWRAVNA